MAEQSVNVTLQQATIQHRKSITSISNLTSVEYEEEYSFLNDNSLNDQHAQISNVRLNPPQQNYQVRFYEVKNYHTLTNGPYIGQQQNQKHKIMSLYVKQKCSGQEVARLPRCNYPIQLQVETHGQGLLFGKLKQEENEMESLLFNKNGLKVASLQYDLRLANWKKDESRLSLFLGQRENTLHSGDFESQSQSASRLRDINHQQKMAKIEQQLSQQLGKIEQEDEPKADKITTMSTSSKVVRIIRRRKKLQSLSQQNSQIQQKGEQDYELTLQDKVGLFRNPFQKRQKLKNEQKKEVNFISLKRNQEELGIPFVNLQQIIYPKSLKSKKKMNQKQKQQLDKVIKALNPQAKTKNQPTSASHPIRFQDYGVGTYTPLSTLKSQLKQSYNSFINKNMRSNGVQVKISKSSNLKLSKLVKQKKKYEKQLQVKQSEQEDQSAHRNYQKRSILNKFFMTNRQQEIINHQSIQRKLTNFKKPLMQRLNLSVQNKVIEIKVQQFPRVQHTTHKIQESISPLSLQKIRLKPKKSLSCRENPQKIESQLISLSDSEIFPEYSLIINNISLNFKKKTFGAKQLRIKMNDTGYLTEKIVGNNLMWASKNYRFQKINENDEISIIVRGQSPQHQFTYGTVKIAFNDLLINKKQRYYQTFLLGEKDVLGILILGYQILKNKDTMKDYIYSQQKRKQHSQSELKKMQDQSRKAKKLKKLQNFLNEDIKKKLPNPKSNKIKVKKYLGGKNIKIGRASRFQDSANLQHPGPGKYNLESDFTRHAQKQD